MNPTKEDIDIKTWKTWTYGVLHQNYKMYIESDDDSAGALLNARLTYHKKRTSPEQQTQEMIFKDIDKFLKRLLNDEAFTMYKGIIQSKNIQKKDALIWSVIINRRDNVTHLLKEGGNSIYGALFASAMFKMLSKLANAEENIELGTLFLDNYRYFEALACNGVAQMYMDQRSMSQKLLTRPVDEYGGSMKTVMEFSANNELMQFMGTTACQAKLNSIWRYHLSIFTSREMIITCIFLPFLIPRIKFVTHKTDGKKGNTQPFLDIQWCGLTNSTDNKIGLFDAVCRFYSAPVTKFWTNLISYLVMLFCFSFFVLTDLHPVLDGQPALMSMESFMFFWTSTLFLEECRQVWQKQQRSLWHKIRSWWTNAWNKFDATMYILFLLSVVLRFSLSEENFSWARMTYSITLAAFIMRTLHFFYVAKNIGPKIIMIGNMMTDIQFFVMICFVVLVSFGTVMQANLFPNSEPTWQLVKDVIYLPYWQMYGELSLETIEGQKTSSCTTEPSIYRNGTLPRCPESTVFVPIVLAIFMVLTNIMLMNLLIAMFSNTFQTVQDNSVLIWKFYRYSLVHEYYERPLLVPPLIILDHLYRFLRYRIKKWCWEDDKTFNAFKHNIPKEETELVDDSERKAMNKCLSKLDDRDGYNFTRDGSFYGYPNANRI